MADVRGLVVIALAFVACAGESDGDDASVIGCAPDGPFPHADCECVPRQSNAILDLPTCAPVLCSVAVALVPSSCGVFESVDESALSCALGALETRTPGVVTWDAVGGECGRTGYVLILDEHHAITRDIRRFPDNSRISDAIRGELSPSSHFAACAANADPKARFECLESPIAASPLDESPVLVCDQSGCGI